jgi:hypothetical protein
MPHRHQPPVQRRAFTIDRTAVLSVSSLCRRSPPRLMEVYE